MDNKQTHLNQAQQLLDMLRLPAHTLTTNIVRLFEKSVLKADATIAEFGVTQAELENIKQLGRLEELREAHDNFLDVKQYKDADEAVKAYVNLFQLFEATNEEHLHIFYSIHQSFNCKNCELIIASLKNDTLSHQQFTGYLSNLKAFLTDLKLLKLDEEITNASLKQFDLQLDDIPAIEHKAKLHDLTIRAQNYVKLYGKSQREIEECTLESQNPIQELANQLIDLGASIDELNLNEEDKSKLNAMIIDHNAVQA